MTDLGRRLLLDTHVWVWYVEAMEQDLGPTLRDILIQANIERGVWVSVMSAWEVAVLEAKRRVALSLECSAWIDRALSATGVHLQPLTPAIAIASTRLAGFAHRDPVDRILVATARLTGATLVTRDRRILDYAAKGYLRALDATPPAETSSF
jgi:PIN domain nuclease of toxin-antitoxin system